MSAPATRPFRPHQPLARKGEVQAEILLLEEGWACSFVPLRNGRRQITALFLPGDYCEPQWLLGQVARQTTAAITPVRARAIPISATGPRQGPTQDVQNILAALLANMSRQADWIVRIGRNTATERVGALLCELFRRMSNAGLGYGQQCAMPLTQMDLADILGLTPVHVNRVLRELRALGLVELQSKWLRLPDLSALMQLSGAISQPDDHAARPPSIAK